jgi:hypothetical protein
MAENGVLAHTGEGGSNAADRIEETGLPLTGEWRVAENVAYTSIAGGADSGETDRMHDGLMESAGHRANILDRDVSFVGIGLSSGRITVDGVNYDAMFLTQNFAETDGPVLVQEEADGATVLQPYQDGEPVGEPQPVETPPSGEPDAQDDEEQRDDESGSASGGGCFVATAAFGGRAHPDVAALRRFRDEVLVRHRAGRAFIRAYAIVGPRLARVVRHDRASGRLARGLIAPLARLAGGWTHRR